MVIAGRGHEEEKGRSHGGPDHQPAEKTHFLSSVHIHVIESPFEQQRDGP